MLQLAQLAAGFPGAKLKMTAGHAGTWLIFDSSCQNLAQQHAILITCKDHRLMPVEHML